MNLLKILLPAVAILLSAGCTRHVVQPVETLHIRSDTLRSHSLRIDSVILRDSVVLIERGDTVIREVWRQRDRLLRSDDSRHSSHTDTLIREIPVEIEKRVETAGPLSTPQKIRMRAGDLFIAIILILTIYLILKNRKR